MADEEYGQLLSFNGLQFGESTEHAFVHGVEFGQLWALMRGGTVAEISETIHAINREVVERAAAAEGWTAEFRDVADGWIVVDMKKSQASRRNPSGLRVVN